MKMNRKTALFAALCLLLTGCGPSYTGGGIPVDVSENHEETAESSSASSSEAEEEEKAAYVWYLEPFLEAEDVNAVAEENADFNYGYHMDTALSVFQKDGRLGLIGNDGELITEAIYQNVTGSQDPANPHYGLTAPDTPGRDEVYCLSLQKCFTADLPECPGCGTTFSTCAGGSGYCYDEKLMQTFQYEPDAVHREPAGDQIGMLGQFMFEPCTTAETVVARSILMPENYLEPDYETKVLFNEGLGLVRDNKLISGMDYEAATDFKDGLAALCKNGKWGYLNADGETVIPFEYDADFRWRFGYEYDWTYDGDTEHCVFEEYRMAYLPSEGYLALNQGDQAGYVDPEGNVIVPIGTFAAARPVHDKLAWVQDASGLWGVISFDLSRKPAELPENDTAESEAEPAESSAQETEAPQQDADGWREAYAEVLRSEGQSHFGLVYVDDNDIPELVVHRGGMNDLFHANTDIELYTYYNGQAVDLGQHSTDGYSQFGYAERQGLVVDSWIQMGYIISTYWRLENGQLTKVLSTYSDEASAEGYENPTYKINDVVVDKEEYLEKCKPYDGISLNFDNGDYETNEANINAHILN